MKNLHENTIKLLEDSEIPLSEIAKGSNVGYRWLCQLQVGKFKDPGVKKIQRIHDFLSAKSSEIGAQISETA